MQKAPETGAFDDGSKRNLRRGARCLAERTGLEPATPGVTGRYSHQLNYRSAAVCFNVFNTPRCQGSGYHMPANWRPLGDSNPCTHRERVMS